MYYSCASLKLPKGEVQGLPASLPALLLDQPVQLQDELVQLAGDVK